MHDAPILFEGLPVNIAVMMVGKKDAAVLGALPWTSALGEFTLDNPEYRWALPPDIGPSVAWIMQHGTNKRLRRHLPHEPGALAVMLVDGQFQASALELMSRHIF